jgi:3-oxoadipate CoA-transferase beta subunit
MMRGGHLDVCIMGAFQVSAGGDLANWSTGAPDAIPAVGGAMDLAIGAKQVHRRRDLPDRGRRPGAGGGDIRDLVRRACRPPGRAAHSLIR